MAPRAPRPYTTYHHLGLIHQPTQRIMGPSSVAQVAHFKFSRPAPASFSAPVHSGRASCCSTHTTMPSAPWVARRRSRKRRNFAIARWGKSADDARRIANDKPRREHDMDGVAWPISSLGLRTLEAIPCADDWTDRQALDDRSNRIDGGQITWRRKPAFVSAHSFSAFRPLHLFEVFLDSLAPAEKIAL